MGLCGSGNAETRKNREIEQAQHKAKKKQEDVIKMLLLGAGESGKSTLFKQMKILYGKPFEVEELKELVPVINGNIMANILRLLENAESKEVEFEDKEALASFLENYSDDTIIDSNVANDLRKIWNDKGCKELWEMRAQFQVLECLSYYLAEENLSRIEKIDFSPNEMDLLQARVRTSGIVEERYEIDGVLFSVFDVGGQRNERKKWIHCFENVTATIFVAAISEYDQVLYEDNRTSRISEALSLFDEISNSQWFLRTSIILFLNKDDLFRKKLLTSPVKLDGKRFMDFKGPYVTPGTATAKEGTPEYEACYEAAKNYFTKMFLARNRQKKEIYVHVTCATDTKMTANVLNATKDIILRANLQGSGFVTEDEN